MKHMLNDFFLREKGVGLGFKQDRGTVNRMGKWDHSKSKIRLNEWNADMNAQENKLFFYHMNWFKKCVFIKKSLIAFQM